MSIPKVLITGGFGFIGTNLILQLKKLFYNINVLDNFHPQIHQTKYHFLMKDVELFEGDIRNKDLLTSAIKDVDIIIHLVAETGTGQSQDEIERYCDVNIGGTATLLEVLRNNVHKVKKVILISSRAVYGEGLYKKETDELKPVSIYGITKQVQEQLVKNSCPVAYTILRLQNVYGNYQSVNNPYTGVLNMFMTHIINGEPIRIYDNDEATRDFIYVNDVVKAIQRVMLNWKTDWNIYNIGTGNDITLSELCEAIERVTGKTANIKITDYHRKGDVLNVSADITKAKTELNWFPEYNIDEGLKEFYSMRKNYEN